MRRCGASLARISFRCSPGRTKTARCSRNDELLATCVILLVAGHETTTNLIGNALLALHRHPEQLARLRFDLTLVPSLVEETLRYDGPVQRVRRTATRDVQLGGRTIRRGDTVMAVLAAANRDPAAFDDPHVFKIDRETVGHLAFGHGIHFCVGAGLARLEAPIALHTLLERFPAFNLPEEWTPEWNPSLTLRGLRRLPLTLV